MGECYVTIEAVHDTRVLNGSSMCRARPFSLALVDDHGNRRSDASWSAIETPGAAALDGMFAIEVQPDLTNRHSLAATDLGNELPFDLARPSPAELGWMPTDRTKAGIPYRAAPSRPPFGIVTDQDRRVYASLKPGSDERLAIEVKGRRIQCACVSMIEIT